MTGRTRIGSDDARRWVRTLRLENPYAKAILMALANYVNEDGSAFPGVNTLHLDTDIAEDTIISRLRWCQHIGAVVIIKNWIDENGVRNRESRGRLTSNEIRFLIDADPNEIATKAAEGLRTRTLRGAARRSHEAATSSRPHGEQTDELATDAGGSKNEVSSRLAPCLLPTRADRIEEEEESKKEPPNPPSGGDRVVDRELEKDLDELGASYPAPITNLPRLRTILAAMTGQERRKVVVASKGYASYIRDLERRGKRRAVKDADRWVAAGMWQGYVHAGDKAEVAALANKVPTDGDTGKAWATLHRIAHAPEPLSNGGFYYLRQPLSDRVHALAKAPPESEWLFISAEQENQCGAWRSFLSSEMQNLVRPELVWTRNPGGRPGFMAPWPWPPRKDGTLSTAPPAPTISDRDLQDFA